ncbi:MAG: terpene cyclase/mutase family protein [bacterium]|nr:terpene cyclase/mutase family protein [bacterium]
MNDQYSDIQIETTLPKPWEEEESFNDVLYDWMSRAPWLAISAAAHLVVFLIIQAIPWNLFGNQGDTEINASIEQAPEEVVEDPPEEPEEEIEEEETEEEPIIQDFEISDHNETDTDEDFEATEGDPDMLADSPFDDKAFNDVIGIGGGAGGKFGGRFGGRRNLRAAGGSGTEQALRDGLEWLKNHQAPDGSWDCDEFMHNNVEGGCTCDGPGDPLHDVGTTGIALLAFLGDGNTMRDGPYKNVVTQGIKWLRQQQDFETGLLGEEIGHTFLYDHGIATLAITEAYYFSKSPLIKGTAQKAINYVTRARNPYGAWRYDVPPVGDNDSSVTGWMIFALKSAEEAGLKIDKEAYVGALNWFDEVTDPANGRVGYDSMGSVSSRVTGVNDHYPPEKGESMTAVGLLCRFFLGQDPSETPIMGKHADLMLKTLPEWDPEGFGCDMYYWYYGSYAMYQMGGRHWKGWNVAMKKAVLESQRKDSHFKGSWDPIGPWGHAGGRVYSTASMVLCLEVYFRYARVLGAR